MPGVVITVVGRRKEIIVIFLVVNIRGGEGRIDVLRSLLVFGVLARLHTRYISILERAIFIESTTNEVGTIRQVRSTRANLKVPSAGSSDLLTNWAHLD